MPAWIRGRAVSRDEAIDAAGRMLGAARTTLVAGLAADVAAIEAAYRLAARIGASIDPAGSDALYAELAAVAAGGAMATTFAEAKARADCLAFIGDRPGRSALAQELVNSVPRRGEAHARRVVSLGGQRSVRVDAHVGAAAGRVPAQLGLLRAVVGGRLLPGAGHEAGLAEMADILAGAAFAVLIYDPAELGDLGVEMLQGLVKDLNETTRCSSLPLGKAAPGRGAIPVGAWMTGGAPRIGLGRGVPEHDPWRFDANRLIEAGECEAALWLAALPCDPPPWLAAGRAVALLGRPSGREAEIVFAVAVPGIDAGGVVHDVRRGTLCYSEAGAPSDAEPAACLIGAIERAASTPRAAAPC